MKLPTDAEERKGIPLATGVLDYFPDALAEVAKVSKAGNDQHNPGQPLHWAKEKSTDHADCILRHLVDRGKHDGDGLRHSAKVAWRALALLQTELEEDVITKEKVMSAVKTLGDPRETPVSEIFDPEKVLDWAAEQGQHASVEGYEVEEYLVEPFVQTVLPDIKAINEAKKRFLDDPWKRYCRTFPRRVEENNGR